MATHTHPHPEPPDTLGQILSAVCAVHCVTMPLFVALTPAAASVLGGAHPVLLVLVIAVALWAFVPGYRCHRDASVVVLAICGVTALAVATVFLAGDWAQETAVSILGAALMMVAHWRNRKLLHRKHSH